MVKYVRVQVFKTILEVALITFFMNQMLISKIRYRIIFSTRYPWPDHDECKMLATVFCTQQHLPAIALASFPNSGNTWLRSMIEGLTGIFTGSFWKHSWNGFSASKYDKNGINFIKRIVMSILATRVHYVLHNIWSYLLQVTLESLFHQILV